MNDMAPHSIAKRLCTDGINLARRNASFVAVALAVVLCLFACSDRKTEDKSATPIGTVTQAATVDLDESYVVMGRKSVMLRAMASA